MAPFPFPAHQTGRAHFEHPAFRQSSCQAHGGRSRFGAGQTLHAELPEDLAPGITRARRVRRTWRAAQTIRFTSSFQIRD